MEQNKIILLQANLDGNARKIPLTAHNAQELVNSIRQLYSLSERHTLALKYRDDEGDLVSLKTDEDFEESLLCSKDNILDIQVAITNKDQLPQSSDQEGSWLDDLGETIETKFAELAENKTIQERLNTFFTPIRSFFSTLLEASKDRCNDEGEKKQRGFLCTGCSTRIVTGSRYRCLQCKNVDYCASCIHQKKQEHPSEHIFKEFVECPPSRPNPEPHKDQEQESSLETNVSPKSVDSPPKIYHNAFCNVCDEKIEGIRWKCFECEDVDLCQACYVEHKGSDKIKGHLNTHSFARMDDPQKYFTFLQEKESYLDQKKIQGEGISVSEPAEEPVTAEKKEEETEEDRKEIERVKGVIKEKIRLKKEKTEKNEEEENKEEIKAPSPSMQKYPFEEKLEVLQSMGFEDRKRNIMVLVSNKGDLQKSVDQLLS